MKRIRPRPITNVVRRGLSSQGGVAGARRVHALRLFIGHSCTRLRRCANRAHFLVCYRPLCATTTQKPLATPPRHCLVTRFYVPRCSAFHCMHTPTAHGTHARPVRTTQRRRSCLVPVSSLLCTTMRRKRLMGTLFALGLTKRGIYVAHNKPNATSLSAGLIN